MPMDDLREQRIRERAYEVYLQRGGEDGHALADWLDAEQQLEAEEMSKSRTENPVLARADARTMAAGGGKGD